MTIEQEKRLNEVAARVAAMSDAELSALIANDQCPYEPEHLIDVPLGMFHCPLCGEMVLAGEAHPKQLTPQDWVELGRLANEAERREQWQSAEWFMQWEERAKGAA